MPFRRKPRHGYALLAYRVAWAKTFRRWEPRWQRRKRERCPHPPERYYGAIAADGTHWMGCCVCGKLLMEDTEYGARSAQRQAKLAQERAKAKRRTDGKQARDATTSERPRAVESRA